MKRFLYTVLVLCEYSSFCAYLISKMLSLDLCMLIIELFFLSYSKMLSLDQRYLLRPINVDLLLLFSKKSYANIIS